MHCTQWRVQMLNTHYQSIVFISHVITDHTSPLCIDNPILYKKFYSIILLKLVMILIWLFILLSEYTIVCDMWRCSPVQYVSLKSILIKQSYWRIVILWDTVLCNDTQPTGYACLCCKLAIYQPKKMQSSRQHLSMMCNALVRWDIRTAAKTENR